MTYLTRIAFCFTLAVVFCFGATQAQPLSVKVRDTNREPLTGATVQLIALPDSTPVYKTTDTKGLARFDDVKNGLYLLRISFVGFETSEKMLNLRQERRYFEYQLKEASVALGEVTITAKRPLITQEDDKMIIDPEPMVAISTNTLEVLESTPGLYVDQDGGIYLNSATPAVIFINGREQKMSTQDINTLLRNLPPGSVQRIEVLRTPSTKYDASSSGGIVNIVLKKGVKLGQFGTATAGFNQGKYGNRFAGISYNAGGEKSSYYGNLNYNYDERLEEINSVRFLNNDTAITQTATSRPQSHQLYTGYGISYDLAEKLTLSYDGRINASSRLTTSQNNNIINAFDTLKLLESDNSIDADILFLNIQQDFGLVRKFDTLGSELDTKLSYSFNNNKADQDYLTAYTFPLQLDVPSQSDNLQYRHFVQLQSDLTYNLPLEIKLETGFKSTLQSYNSQVDFFNFQADTAVKDTLKTNAFNYIERINAAYLQASRKLWADILLKAGIRMEHTYMNGHQTIPRDTSFIVSRADWFPYIYLSRPFKIIFDIDLQAYLIYRRTINRPDYQSLNPYIRYTDQFLYETGNPALKPQFTENVEFNVSYDDTPLFAVGQNYTTDIFSSVTYQDKNNPNIAVRTYDNLGSSKETYLRGIVGIPPGGRYFFAVGAQYNMNEFDGFYENEPFTYERGSWRFFTFHSLKLFKETRLRLNGFMMQNGSWNFYELKNFGQLNFGITQTLFDKKLTISFSARDILRTMKTEFTLNQGSIRSTGDRYTDSQRYGINIRYNFGIKDKEEKKPFMKENGEE